MSINFTPIEENNEVNHFVGWEIYIASKKFIFQEEAISGEKKQSIDCECKNVLLFMVTRKKELDTIYLYNCHDPNSSMLNHGELTLVREEYFD